MTVSRKLAFPLISMLWSTTLLAAPVNVSWNATNIDATADSRSGGLNVFTNLGALPEVPTTVRDLNPASGAVPPVDTTQTEIQINPGFLNERRAQGRVTVTGSVGGGMSMANGGSSNVRNLSDVVIHGAQFNGTGSFTGSFVSNGTVLDLAYDGLYSLFAFGQNGVAPSPQRAFARVSASLLVEDVTAGTTLASTALLTDSREQALCGSPCLPFSLSDAAFNDTFSLDLGATVGHDIQVTLTTAVVTKAYAGHFAFDSSGQRTGGIANASFGAFNFGFTTGEAQLTVPEPPMLAIFAMAVAVLACARRRRAA
jgi:hypothetical protein